MLKQQKLDKRALISGLFPHLYQYWRDEGSGAWPNRALASLSVILPQVASILPIKGFTYFVRADLSFFSSKKAAAGRPDLLNNIRDVCKSLTCLLLFNAWSKPRSIMLR